MEIKQCDKCLMDSTASDFIKNEDGSCNFCTSLISLMKSNTKTFDSNQFEVLINSINLDSKNNDYDCIIGVSGGVDSSWVLVKAIESGLKPLAVHMDNGWNSELAQNNISNLVKTLNVDLITHVINWEEYRSLMQSFFDANVLDVELLYDNAMLAVNYQLANKFNIKYILSGMNTSTEGMKMPVNWNWFKYDKKQIKYFSKSTYLKSIKTFPAIGTLDYIYYRFFKKINWIHFLDYLDFNKEDALVELEKKYGYKRYPYKHYESVFTRFYQGYILPKKFNVDKRKLHLSNLVITNQMKRKEALSILKNPPYDTNELKSDIDYFLKKMKWDKNDLNNYIATKEISHESYPSETSFWDYTLKVNSFLKKIKF